LLSGFQVIPEHRLHGLPKPPVEFHCQIGGFQTNIFIGMTEDFWQDFENWFRIDGFAAIIVKDGS
jgi:hypothetical protein